MIQAQTKQVSENPFYGKVGLLDMQRTLERSEQLTQSQVNSVLSRAWQECSTTEDKQLFFIIMFSAGDIENREHNMFKGKVDQGGHSKRAIFRMCLQWTLRTPAANENFYQLLPLIAEYTNYENLFYNQLRTDIKSKRVTSWEALAIDKARVAKYLAEKLTDSTTTEFEKGLIAKFLPKKPMSKRWRKDKDGKSFAQPKRSDTLIKDEWNLQLIAEVKKACLWHTEEYTKFRSHYLKDTEAHLFSSKKICEFDTLEFKAWLNKQPAGARYRVQRRLLDVDKDSYNKALVSNGKWKLKNGQDMGKVYLEWIKEKEVAMKKLASLSEEDKREMSTEELTKLQKTAKINTGANTLYETFLEMYKHSHTLDYSNPETQVKMQQLVDKIKLEVPVMVVVDNSGSMGSSIRTKDGTYIDRLQLAKFCAAVMLYKNPDPAMKSFMMTFNSEATVYHDGGYVETTTGKNRFIQTKRDVKVESLVKRDKPFVETFKQIDSLFQTAGYTSLACVAQELKRWTEEDPDSKQQKIEAIRAYPVWLVISDGDLNSHGSPKASIEAFQRDMLHWFSATPVVVVWDIVTDSPSHNNTEFVGLDNMIHVTGVNAGVINAIFSNINDLDIIDIFITLKTSFLSDRYEPIKQVIK